MPDQIAVRYSISVQIAGGPSLSLAENIYTNAYERIVVQLDEKDGATPKKSVNLPSKIDFLAFTASSYGDDVIYSTNPGTANDTKFTAPLVLIGMSAVERFIGGSASGSGATPLSFVNNSDQPVTIEITVTHDAVEAVASPSSTASTPTSFTGGASSPKSKSGRTSPENQPTEGASPEAMPTMN